MRRSALSTTYSFLQNFLFVVVPALALSSIIGTDAVWVAFPIGEALTLVAIVALAAVRKGGVPFGFKDFLFLKEPFGAPEDEVLDPGRKHWHKDGVSHGQTGNVCEHARPQCSYAAYIVVDSVLLFTALAFTEHYPLDMI